MAPPSIPEEAPRDNPPASFQGDILVVDDDAIIRRVITAYLQKAGYSVVVAESGEQAWEKIQAKTPAMVITDWNMPGMTGPELSQRIRESIADHVYIIVATSRSTDEDALQAVEAGADDFLAKPIDQTELLARIRQGQIALSRMTQQHALSSIDPLTGAYNRRVFDEDCKWQIDHARQSQTALSCLLIDIDFFKHINDTYGHGCGDDALRNVAECLRSVLRENDRVYRYGGDEFCILLRGVTESDAVNRALAMQSRISKVQINAGDRRFSLRVTIGVAGWREDIDSAGQLVDLADEALMVAKQSGRDQVMQLSRLKQAELDKRHIQDDVWEGRVEYIMTTPPLTLKASDSIWEAAELFVSLRVDSIPVVDEDGSLIGVVSEQELFQEFPGEKDWDAEVRSSMQTNYVCYDVATPLKQVWEFFRRVALSRVVIVEHGKPVGTISRGALLRWAAHNHFAQRIESDGNRERYLTHASGIASAIREDMDRLQANATPEYPHWHPHLICATTRLQEQAEELLGCGRPTSDIPLKSGEHCRFVY